MNIDPRDNRTRARRGKITLSVGPQSGDLQSSDDKALQAALDYLNRLGGGLLQILPGEYTLHNALYLHPNLEIAGAGEATVLKKAPSVTSPFVRLTEWYETQVQVEDPSGFFPGCGVMLQWGPQKYPNRARPQHTVLEVDGDILTLDCEAISGVGPEQEARVTTLFP